MNRALDAIHLLIAFSFAPSANAGSPEAQKASEATTSHRSDTEGHFLEQQNSSPFLPQFSWSNQNLRRRQLIKEGHVCEEEDEHQFFYEIDIRMEVEGGDPQCSEHDLTKVAEILTNEYQTMISVDPRLSAVYELHTDLCSPIPQGDEAESSFSSYANAVAIPTSSGVSEEKCCSLGEDDSCSDNEWCNFNEYQCSQCNNGNYIDIPASTSSPSSNGSRKLSYWYHMRYKEGVGRTYGFDWVGNGDCRWCPPNPKKRDRPTQRRFLRKDSSSGSVTTNNPTERQEVDHARELSSTSRPRIKDFALFEAGVTNPRRIRTVNDFAIIDLAKVATNRLALVAETVKSVQEIHFSFDQTSDFRTQRSLPFAVAGVDEDGSTDTESEKMLLDFADMLQLGTHTVTGIPKDATGAEGDPMTIAFLVIDSSKYDDVPDDDPEVIDILEQDLSFHLSFQINERFYGDTNHCLAQHLVYISVNLKNARVTNEYQCDNDGVGGNTNTDTTTACMNCCLGAESCVGNTGSIADGACNGYRACQGNSGNIHARACQGINSCQDNEGDIFEDSCNGYVSCLNNQNQIGANSCNLNESCENNHGTIGSGSCQGYSSCERNYGSILDFACGGNNSCKRNAAAATIGREACRAYGSCESNAGEIQQSACGGGNSCRGNAVDSVIKQGACSGNTSCRSNSKEIGEYACGGDQSCHSNSGVIGDRSCVGFGSCRNNVATIEADQCSADNSC